MASTDDVTSSSVEMSGDSAMDKNAPADVLLTGDPFFNHLILRLAQKVECLQTTLREKKIDLRVKAGGQFKKKVKGRPFMLFILSRFSSGSIVSTSSQIERRPFQPSSCRFSRFGIFADHDRIAAFGAGLHHQEAQL